MHGPRTTVQALGHPPLVRSSPFLRSRLAAPSCSTTTTTSTQTTSSWHRHSPAHPALHATPVLPKATADGGSVQPRAHRGAMTPRPAGGKTPAPLPPTSPRRALYKGSGLCDRTTCPTVPPQPTAVSTGYDNGRTTEGSDGAPSRLDLSYPLAPAKAPLAAAMDAARYRCALSAAIIAPGLATEVLTL